jgi:hypothetical protein
MRPLGAIDRARQVDPPSFEGHDGRALARLAVLARELQRDAGNDAFRLPVKLARDFCGLTSIAHAGGLLRSLEMRGILRCIKRGTATKGDVKGMPTLWRYNEARVPHGTPNDH